MARVSVSEGKVCIIKVEEFSSTSAGLTQIKNALIDFTTSDKVLKTDMDIFVFIDLSPFEIINSDLIGTIGSSVMVERVQNLGLCGIRPSVVEILKKTGVLEQDSDEFDSTFNDHRKNLKKITSYKNLEEALINLAPST